MFRNANHPIWKVILSGILLSFAWPGTGSLTPLIFVAFLPLLWVEHQFFKEGKPGIFRYAFLSFLIWNIGSTYFIFYVEEPFITKFTASAITYILNALFMATVFWLFHKTKKNIGLKQGYIGLVIFWLCFEYIHYHWDINWPWLNLGNVFANRITWIQWYEFTGVQGGTIWIWLVNLLALRIVLDWAKKDKKIIALASGLILFPILLSVIMFFNYEENGEAINVALVQPNIDPYTEKFDTDPNEQLDRMLDLAEETIDLNTQVIVFPETAIQERGWIDGRTGVPVLRGMWESNFENTYSYRQLSEFVSTHPKVNLIVGASIRKKYGKEKETLTARYFKEDDFYYDSFNSAILFNNEGYEYYHKGKLVPGTEKMPFAKYLSFLEKLSWDLGGASGSLGKQEEREVFNFPNAKIAPMICYESVFGEYVSDYTKLGANSFCIITNDAWWQDAPGYKQHLHYASLRAIENRRSIARSANTGISCFINQRGEILQATNYDEKVAIKGTINKNEKLTVYSMYGDYLTRPLIFVAVLLVLWTFFKPKKKEKERKAV